MSFQYLLSHLSTWLGESSKEFQKDHRHTHLKPMTPLAAKTISSLFPYEAFDEEQQLFINQNSVGFWLEISSLTGASCQTEKEFQRILSSSVPDTAHFSLTLYGSPKIGPWLDRYQKRREAPGGLFAEVATARAEFLKKGAFDALYPSGHQEHHMRLRDIRLFVSVSMPLGQETRLLRCREELVNAFKSLQITSQHVDASGFLAILEEWLHPSLTLQLPSLAWQKGELLNEQLVHPGFEWRHDKEKLTCTTEANETFIVKSFNARRFPEHMSLSAMTQAIGHLFESPAQLSCPFWVTLSLSLLDSEKALGLAQMKSLSVERSATSQIAKFLPNRLKELHDWQQVKSALLEGDQLCRVHFQVSLLMTPEHEVEALQKFKKLYKSVGFDMVHEPYVQLPAFLSHFPFQMGEGLWQDFKLLNRLRTCLLSEAVRMLPVVSEWKGDIDGEILFAGRRGQLGFWSPFNQKVGGNYNVAVAAASGSGKSVLVQEYILGLLAANHRAWVIDVGRSYEKTCRVLGGTFIEFKMDSMVSINPFSTIDSENIDRFDEDLDLLKPLTALMARPSGHITDEEMSFIEQALKAVWTAKKQQATFTDVADFLNHTAHPIAKNLGILLFPYTRDGMYGRFFEGPATIDFDNRFIVLELEELKSKKDLQQVILFALMYHVSQAMYLGSRAYRKSCIVDEAWDLLGEGNDMSAHFIETGYRRARRYNANFVTITQSIEDYFKNRASLAAYENSNYMVVLAQQPESISRLKKTEQFQMDAYVEMMLRSLKTDQSSECLIRGPSGMSVHRLLLDPLSRILFSSKGEEFEAVKRLEAQGLSLIEAVRTTARKYRYV